MPRLSPEEFAEKHARRLKSALSDIQRGVESVSESPTAKAAQKVEKMRQRILEALESGKWQKGLQRVSLDDWKKKMVNVGLQRISSGIDANKDKVVSFAAELLPYIDQGLEQIKKMPDITLDDSINRVVTWVRHMANFKRK